MIRTITPDEFLRIPEGKRSRRMCFATTRENQRATCNFACQVGKTPSETIHEIVSEFHQESKVNVVNGLHPLVLRAQRLQELTRRVTADGHVSFLEFMQILFHLFGFQTGLYRARQRTIRVGRTA